MPLQDPNDTKAPNTMFTNAIFQLILNAIWFGTKECNRAFYFRDKTKLELVTLALIVVAVSASY